MGHFHKYNTVFFAFLAISISHSVSMAQVTVSSISGNVFDPAGRVIQGARVVVVDTFHATTRTATTDASGGYQIIALQPAEYTASVTAPGFAELVRSDISLPVDTALKLDFRLQVGGPTTKIEVTAPVRELQTERGDLGAVIDQQLVETLPLNSRDFLQLSLLAPGVSPSVEGSQDSTYGSVSMEVNGGREEFNNFLLDGVDNNDSYVNRYAVEPAVDSVQEFKMDTSSYDAEYGRSAAGQVNVITRSGSNSFHATAYEYLRNKVLDARNYFDGAGFTKPPFIRNQFGAAVGGPIRKDKTFFFANTDFFRLRTSESQESVVPTDDERAGNLAAVAAQGATILNPQTGQPFHNNIVPVSPIAANILKLYPECNYPSYPLCNQNGSGSNNYLGQPSAPENHVQNTFRGDHQISANDELTLRYSMGIVDRFEPYPEGVADPVVGFGNSGDDHGHNALVREQHSFGAKAINSAFFGFNRFSRDFVVQNSQVNADSLWGVSWLPNLAARDYGYPQIQVEGKYGALGQVGDNPNFPNLNHNNTYQVGGEIRKLQLNGHLEPYARGSLIFSGSPYESISGSGISDLLLGDPFLAIQAQANNPIHLRSTSYDVYFQDDWKLLSNLTLNLGGRYEFNSPATDPKNAMSEFVPQTGQIVPVGTNGVSDSGFSPDYKNFAPRLGLAWSVAPNLVVRAGYGVYYDAGMFIVGSSAYFNPPQYTADVYFEPPLQNPFAGYNISPAQLSALSPKMITPYLQQWNLTTETSVGKRGTLTLSYVGTAGSHLIRASDLNQPALCPPSESPMTCQNNLQSGSSRPYPAYSSIGYIESEGSSNYNAFEAHFTGRVSSALSLWSSYTWSHSIDSQSAFLNDAADENFPQDSHNLAAERGPSSFDMRQHFVVAYIVTLPHGNRWTRNTEFQGIATVESGQPFTPMISTDNANTGDANSPGQSGVNRPNRVGDPFKSGHVAANSTCVAPAGPVHTAAQWFNPCAFETAAPDTYGDAGRNSLLGPDFSSFDISLLRRFTLPERATLTFEVESFNLFNKPNFDLPQAFTDLPNSGEISSADQRGQNPRQLQLAARLSF
jgi:outer membrane receptor protein involved in Fe transport